MLRFHVICCPRRHRQLIRNKFILFRGKVFQSCWNISIHQYIFPNNLFKMTAMLKSRKLTYIVGRCERCTQFCYFTFAKPKTACYNSKVDSTSLTNGSHYYQSQPVRFAWILPVTSVNIKTHHASVGASFLRRTTCVPLCHNNKKKNSHKYDVCLVLNISTSVRLSWVPFHLLIKSITTAVQRPTDIFRRNGYPHASLATHPARWTPSRHESPHRWPYKAPLSAFYQVFPPPAIGPRKVYKL